MVLRFDDEQRRAPGPLPGADHSGAGGRQRVLRKAITYPRSDVMKILENLEPIPGHEPPAIPNWSRVLRTTEGDDERVIRRRLEALVEHVATLQQK